MVPTMVEVHPAGLYEATFALALAAALWELRTRLAPLMLVGVYAVSSGAARFLVEEEPLNDEVLFGLTQPQLWSIALFATGIVLIGAGGRRERVTLTETRSTLQRV